MQSTGLDHAFPADHDSSGWIAARSQRLEKAAEDRSTRQDWATQPPLIPPPSTATPEDVERWDGLS